MKAIINFFYKIGTYVHKGVALALAAAIVALLLFLSTTWFEAAYYKVIDYDADRGATTVARDALGDSFTRIAYLPQGWTESDSLWFYNTTQGSDLLPYDFFIALEQEKSQELLRAPENMNRYRYLPQKKTRSNPDALPLGMVADTYLGKKYMGYTCAACHTSQVNYNGVGIRIDGGPAAADMNMFMEDLARALRATLTDDAKLRRFTTAVQVGYADAAEVKKELEVYALRIEAYNFFNDSFVRASPEIKVPYGYARLDAFGRIYNRVLEHVINPETLHDVLTNTLPLDELQTMLATLKPVLSSENRDHVMERLVKLLTVSQRELLRDKLFNSPNGPVSYPFLWDIPQHDYVQWNGIAANAGVGPIGRNAGEVIGVFGTLDWAEKNGWTVSSVIGGQGFGPTHISFQSSANVHNLKQLESRLVTLQSPAWEDAVKEKLLPPLDEARVQRGGRLFDAHCAKCHAGIDRTSASRRIVAHLDSLKEAGTDATSSNNGVDDEGFSGILRNQYLTTDVGGVLLNTKAPVAALLTQATLNVVATPDPDKWFFTRAADWATDLLSAIFSNQIKPSVKSGNYLPDTTAVPFESVRSYKARALNGIWATAPYLHNGSVPTLYDLLLPAAPQEGDPVGTTYRPKMFKVGSRELDVKKVGFKYADYDGFPFDTSLPGNGNAGHEYATRKPGLTDEQRWDLVEYLKGL